MIAAILTRFTWPYALVVFGLLGGALFTAGLGFSWRMYDQGYAAGWSDAQAVLDRATEETRERIGDAPISIGDTADDLDFLRDRFERLHQ